MLGDWLSIGLLGKGTSECLCMTWWEWTNQTVFEISMFLHTEIGMFGCIVNRGYYQRKRFPYPFSQGPVQLVTVRKTCKDTQPSSVMTNSDGACSVNQQDVASLILFFGNLISFLTLQPRRVEAISR